MGLVEAVPLDPERGVLYVTSTGSILTATSGFTDVFGYSLAEIKSKHVTSLASETSEWDAMLHAILAKASPLPPLSRQTPVSTPLPPTPHSANLVC